MRATVHLHLALEDAHASGKNIILGYLDFKGAFPSINHIQLVRILEFLGLPEDFIQIVTHLYEGATTTFITPHGPTAPIPIQRSTMQGDPLSPYCSTLWLNPSSTGGYQRPWLPHARREPPCQQMVRR